MIKFSYKCMPNSFGKKIVYNSIAVRKYMEEEECPLSGEFLTENIKYHATDDGKEKTYAGWSAKSF